MYDISDWYWLVGDDETKVWSSYSAGFVPIDSDSYKSWREKIGNSPTLIKSLEELKEVFVANYPAGSLDTYTAAKRYERETGGITIAGATIATDDRSKLMITGARIKAESDSSFTTTWKTRDGRISLDAPTIINISNAVLSHVNECFELEDRILTAIEDGGITSRDQIDTLFA